MHYRIGPSLVKRAFLPELKEQWEGLGTPQKWEAGIGGGMAGLALLNSLAHGADTRDALVGLGGLALGAHGLSGGHLSNLLQLFGKKPVPAPTPAPSSESRGGSPAPSGLTLQQAATHPQLSKFFNPDGTPRFADVVKAPDEELRSGVGLLSPDARGQLRTQLAGFKPGLGQRLGAKAMGIDIEGQRARMLGLLGPEKTAADAAEGDLGGAAVAGALGGAGLLASRDLSALHGKMQAWHQSLEPTRQLLASGQQPTFADAEQAFRDYARAGQGVAQHRVLGARAGGLMGFIRKLPHLPARAEAWATERGWLSPTPARLGRLQTQSTVVDPMLEHYRRYSDPATPPEWFRDHHVEKAIGTTNARELYDPRIFSTEARQVLTNPALNLEAKHQALSQLNPEAAKIYREAVLGVPGQRFAVGEIGRLAGNRTTAISTPEVYMAHAGRHLPLASRWARGIGMGGLGLAGVLLARRLLVPREKQAEAPEESSPLPGTARLGGGAALLAGGGMALQQGTSRLLSPDRRIGVTYGTMPEIGEGHAAPGKAIVQALRNDPRFRRYQMEELARDRHGNMPVPSGPTRHYSALIDTGFGVHSPSEWSEFFHAPAAVHGPAGANLPSGVQPHAELQYLTDQIHSHRGGFGSPWHYRGLLGLKDRDVLAYGPNQARMQQADPSARIHNLGPGVSPALNPEAVRVLTEGNATRQQVLADIDRRLAPQAASDPYAAEQLRKLRSIAPDTKLITVAGAGRGDYTAIRARELADAIAADPELAGKVKVVAFQAGSYGGPTEALLHNNEHVISLGKVMPEFADGRMTSHPYAQLQALSDLNYGATGTSGLHEQLLTKNVQVVPREWGFNYTPDPRINPGSVADRLDKAMQAHGHGPGDLRWQMHLDEFNAGNLQYAHGRPGVLVADTPHEILSAFKDPSRMATLRAGAESRAAEELQNYRMANRKMRDAILQAARRGTFRQRLLGARTAAGGLGAAGLGYWLLRRRNQEPKF